MGITLFPQQGFEPHGHCPLPTALFAVIIETFYSDGKSFLIRAYRLRRNILRGLLLLTSLRRAICLAFSSSPRL